MDGCHRHGLRTFLRSLRVFHHLLQPDPFHFWWEQLGDLREGPDRTSQQLWQSQHPKNQVRRQVEERRRGTHGFAEVAHHPDG